MIVAEEAAIGSAVGADAATGMVVRPIIAPQQLLEPINPEKGENEEEKEDPPAGVAREAPFLAQ